MNEATLDNTTRRAVDLQIVGGGLAGLLAANLARDVGLSVRLIEKQTTPGGRASSAHHEGFTLNQGPHALYLQGQLRSTLRSLGIDPAGSPPALTGGTGTIGSRRGLLPQGPGSLVRSTLLSRRSKVQLLALLARVPGMDPQDLATLTVDEWLERTTDRQDLRWLLHGLVNLATYNSAADLASADAALSQLQMALGDGVVYVDNGWTAIVDALRSRLSGVDVVTGRVTELVVEPESQRCVTVEGEHRAANTLLAVGAPAVVDRLLGTNLCDAAGPPVQASVLDLGLRRPPTAPVHLALDRGLYFSIHSVAAGLVPTGMTLASLAAYRRPGDDRGAPDTKAALLAHAADNGIGSDDITMERYLHRLTVTWGMPLAARGGLAGRPAPAVAGRPGLYVAGDWVGDRGLLADASAASAGAAVAAVVADRARRAHRTDRARQADRTDRARRADRAHRVDRAPRADRSAGAVSR